MSWRVLIPSFYKIRKNATFYLMLMVQNLGPRNVSCPFGYIDFNTFLPASSTGIYPEEEQCSVLSRSLLLLKPSGYLTYGQVQHPEILHGDCIAFMCSVWISEQTAILAF
jgi:hypothetical protein